MRRLTEDRSRCVLHMQKALTEMNVRLDSVIASITGLTGQRILRAIIDGERDPERLATLRHRGIKADADTIAASLQGTWREEHLPHTVSRCLVAHVRTHQVPGRPPGAPADRPRAKREQVGLPRRGNPTCVIFGPSDFGPAE